MTDAEYLETQRRLMRLAVEVQGLDLDGFLARINEASGAGPAANPTLFRRGAPALAAIGALADAARLMKSVYEEHPADLLGAVLDAYTPEERARAGVV